MLTMFEEGQTFLRSIYICTIQFQPQVNFDDIHLKVKVRPGKCAKHSSLPEYPKINDLDML